MICHFKNSTIVRSILKRVAIWLPLLDESSAPLFTITEAELMADLHSGRGAR